MERAIEVGIYSLAWAVGIGGFIFGTMFAIYTTNTQLLAEARQRQTMKASHTTKTVLSYHIGVSILIYRDGWKNADEHYAEQDREFIVQARAAIKQGYTVIYSSWW
jgi:hypothetical protein